MCRTGRRRGRIEFSLRSRPSSHPSFTPELAELEFAASAGAVTAVGVLRGSLKNCVAGANMPKQEEGDEWKAATKLAAVHKGRAARQHEGCAGVTKVRKFRDWRNGFGAQLSSLVGAWAAQLQQDLDDDGFPGGVDEIVVELEVELGSYEIKWRGII